jgi:Ni/Co efflux regulator RcnB
MKSLATLLLAGMVAGAFAQTTPATTTTNDTRKTEQGAGQDMKDAAHSTGRAAKKTGHAVKKTTKKVVHKGAHATKKGADKVEDKTDSNPK